MDFAGKIDFTEISNAPDSGRGLSAIGLQIGLYYNYYYAYYSLQTMGGNEISS